MIPAVRRQVGKLMENDSILAKMARIPLFDGLAAPDAQRLAESVRSLAVPAQTNLMALAQPGETMYAIVQGTVRVQVEQLNGDLVILAFLGPGNTVGEMSLLEESGRSATRSATVVTMEACQLLWLDRVTFKACLGTMPQLSANLLRVLAWRLRIANESIQALATLDVPGRVARQLAAFAEVYGEPNPAGGVRVPLRITQQDLADSVGASRERVSQVVTDMKKAGLLSVDRGHRFTITDPAALVRRYTITDPAAVVPRYT
jgi:CRP/FNR family cyclic AMP-dependent transcriptional regulator